MDVGRSRDKASSLGCPSDPAVGTVSHVWFSLQPVLTAWHSLPVLDCWPSDKLQQAVTPPPDLPD
jgi:hypothetical protein